MAQYNAANNTSIIKTRHGGEGPEAKD
jgi:hypothetical protein